MGFADQFVDEFVSDDLSPIEACFKIAEAAEDLRAGVKANYRGRWIAARPGDDADRLHRAMNSVPADWPEIITVKTRTAA